MLKLINRLVVSLLGLLLYACASSGMDECTNLQDTGAATSAGHASAVAPQVLPGCLATNPGKINLSTTWSAGPDGPQVEVNATNLCDAKAVYFSLPLQGLAAAPVTVTGTDWAGADALSLALPASSTELHVGIAMLHPQDRPGFSGATELATISFSDTPAAGSPAHSASAAPAVSTRSRINLDYDPMRNEFMWYYRNEGDYDQNGAVTVSDLTPIAVHYGKGTGSLFAEETIESVVDGDGNGQIGVSDLTPIGIGFGRRVDSFKIYSSTPDNYPASPTALSTIVGLQIVPFTASEPLPSAGRRHYTVDSAGVADPNPAYWLRPVDAGSEGIASLIAGQGNLPPVVSLIASQILGLAPLSVTLDATGTTDDGAGPLEYTWLVVESGTILTEAEFEIGGPVRQIELAAGNYIAVVLVRDDDGASAGTSMHLSAVASLGWWTTTVDVVMLNHELFKMLDLELAEVNGEPWLAFCYQDTAGAGRCGVLMGDGLTGAHLIDLQPVYSEANIVSAEIGLLPDGDKAHIFSLLQRPTSAALMHARMTKGDSSPTNHQISYFTTKKTDLSVALLEGRPACSFHDETNGVLKFALADSAAGTTWPAPLTLDDVGDTGEQTGLAITNGAPAITYYSPGGLRIRYIHSVLNGGQPAWNPPTTIKPLPGAVLRGTFEVLPGDLPWLLVHDTVNQDLGSLSGADLQTVNSISATGGNPADLFSTAIINERVCIAWYDQTAASIKFLRSTDELGSVWEPPVEVTSGLLVGALSLAEVAGHATLAWFDGAQQTVHYSILVE